MIEILTFTVVIDLFGWAFIAWLARR